MATFAKKITMLAVHADENSCDYNSSMNHV